MGHTFKPVGLFNLEQASAIDGKPIKLRPQWTKEQCESLRFRPESVRHYRGVYKDQHGKVEDVTFASRHPDYSQYPTPQQRLEWLEQLPHFDFLLFADSELCALVLRVKRGFAYPPHPGLSHMPYTHELIDQIEKRYTDTLTPF